MGKIIPTGGIPGLPVPQYDAPGVRDYSGESMARLGDSVSALGGTMHRVAMQEQEKANKAIMLDATNQVTQLLGKLEYDPEQGYSHINGKNALDRPDGKALWDEYGQLFDESIEPILSGIRNPEIRQQLKLGFDSQRINLQNKIMNHVGRQSEKFTLETAQTSRHLAMEDIARNYNKPSSTLDSIVKITDALKLEASVMGHDDAWVQQKTREFTSTAHATAIQSALNNKDPVTAERYLSANADGMLANDLIKAKKQVTESMDDFVGKQSGTEAIARVQSRIAPTDMTKLFNAMTMQESGGKQFNHDGSVVTSKKGAIGISQIMLETGPEAAKLAGLKWDENRLKNDAGYNRALGEAYFSNLIERYRGDVPKALAAYNGGMGRVQEAEKSAAQWNKSHPDSYRDFLSFMPKETRNYVPEVLKKYEAGLGKPTPPTDKTLRELIAQDPRLNTPERQKIAFNEAKRLRDEQINSIEQYEKDAFAKATSLINSGISYDNLPIGIKEVVNQKAGALRKLEAGLRGKPVTDPMDYIDAISNIDNLASLSDAEFITEWKPKLSQGDFKSIAKMRAEKLGLLPGKGLDTPNTRELNVVLSREFSALGIGLKQKEKELKGIFAKAVTDAVLEQQKVLGKKLTGQELSKFVHEIFIKDVTFRNTFLGINTGTEQKRLIDVTYNDLDSLGIVDELKSKLRDEGVAMPTKNQILMEYWKRKR